MLVLSAISGYTHSNTTLMLPSLINIFWFVRLVSPITVQTWFVPDEYWQSLEVAHQLVFDYGYLTWEWLEGIRSWVYPILIAIVYKNLEIFGVDHRLLLIHVPRLMQVILTAYSELAFFNALSKKISSIHLFCFVFLQTCSWYMFYTASRTLGNTFEMNLALFGCSFYINNQQEPFLFCLLLAVYVRPTSGSFWLPFVMQFLYQQLHWLKSRAGMIAFLKSFILAGFLICMDSALYGRWLLVPLRFLQFNFFSNASKFYGSHPWHWYLTSALPSVMGPALVPLLMLPLYARDKSKKNYFLILLSLSALSYIFFHSMVAHKEIRFLSPIVPLLNVLASYTIVNFSRRWMMATLMCVALSNVPVGAYLSLVHQRGVLDLVESMAVHVNKNDSVLFLMPCHSTPFYSHLHVNASLRFLTCSPQSSLRAEYYATNTSYEDEADQFYGDPMRWMKDHIDPDIPRFLVMFDSLKDNMYTYLKSHDYVLLANVFHRHVTDGRVGQRVLLWSTEHYTKTNDEYRK